MQFRDFCESQRNDFSPAYDGSKQDSHLLVTYNFIIELLEKHVYRGEEPVDDEEFPLIVVDKEDFRRRGCKSLFEKLPRQVSDADYITSKLAILPECEGIVRLLLFASFVVKSVVLTVVEAPTEDIAFDIFDALNTTGEPLTALETLKPHVVRFESGRSGSYLGSPSEMAWLDIERNVLQPYAKPEDRMRETQQLVTGFALYLAGHKVGSDLRIQRNTLRSYFLLASGRGENVAEGFVQSLSQFAQHRSQFWPRESIDALVGPLNEQDDYDMLRLCLRFIRDTSTTTTIPILARYQIEHNVIDDERNFLNALKATAAFLALRRAMTGGTDRIDSDFRSIMSGDPISGGNKLCLGNDLSNVILTVEALKEQLRTLLANHRFSVEGKEQWLNRAREVPLARQASREVCRFLMFAAAHNAMAVQDRPGLSVKQGVIPTPELNFLNHGTWTGEKYTTLEHIAPDAPGSSDWDSGIYEHSDTRHTIGNLVMLPERENSSIGNAPWAKKKLFYRALMAKTQSERTESFELAKREGVEFGNKTLHLIEQQDRLHMLDPIGEIEDWTVDMVRARTENILSLAWDEIAPWLYE